MNEEIHVAPVLGGIFLENTTHLPSDRKYQIILADPPWRYDFSKDSSDSIEAHYPSMSTEEIMALDIPSDDNAILYLWATAPKLEDGLAVMKAWGFTYKTHAVWDKGWVGMGYWFRGQHELLMVGVKGDMHPPKDTERISSVIRSKKREHSRKPDQIRIYIQQWYPDLAKLELFARQRFQGWDVWGLDAPDTIQNLIV